MFLPEAVSASESTPSLLPLGLEFPDPDKYRVGWCPAVMIRPMGLFVFESCGGITLRNMSPVLISEIWSP